MDLLHLVRLDISVLTENLFSLAIIFMLWVIYRQNRTHAELHLTLKPVIWGNKLTDLHLEIANVSARGVWIESVEVATSKLTRRSGTVAGEASVVVPPYDSKMLDCLRAISEAFENIGCDDIPVTGHIRVRARFRVINKVACTPWQRYTLSVTATAHPPSPPPANPNQKLSAPNAARSPLIRCAPCLPPRFLHKRNPQPQVCLLVPRSSPNEGVSPAQEEALARAVTQAGRPAVARRAKAETLARPTAIRQKSYVRARFQACRDTTYKSGALAPEDLCGLPAAGRLKPYVFCCLDGTAEAVP